MNIALTESLPPRLKNTRFVSAISDQMLRGDDLRVSSSDTHKHIRLKVLRRSGDLSPFEDLAHKLVMAADQLDEDYLVIESFSRTVGNFKISCLHRVINGLLKYDPTRLKATFIILRPGSLESPMIISLGFSLHTFYLYRPTFLPEDLEFLKRNLGPSHEVLTGSYRSETREVLGYPRGAKVGDAVWLKTPFAPS
jgi:hypothetical protein